MAFLKKRYILLAALLIIQVFQAQSQGRTLKVMLEQLAALKGYVSTAEKGYRIAEEGIHLVKDLKSGEFSLHQVFFGSLKTVDEATLQCSALAEAKRMSLEIDDRFSRSLAVFGGSRWLQADEMRYIKDLQRNVADQGVHDRESLRILTKDGQLSMMDGDRLTMINQIAMAVRARYGHVKAFLADVAWVIAQRQKENTYTEIIKKWYGIK